MTPYLIIKKKRDGKELSRAEIDFMVNGFIRGEVHDYQMSAFLMAVFFKGMSEKETFELTHTYLESGEKIDLSSLPGIKVDKHSTGGVGDTTTLVLAPIVAASGLPFAKLSGRGLGHTGGTLDKLEAIPGFKIDLSLQEFLSQVKEIGLAIAAQTQNLVPADKKIYALRDVTATVDSLPLICASIMSKKLASGSDAILLDVKTGSGAFMETLNQARELAELMVKVGKLYGKKVKAVITDMDEPLGSYIGNALEVKEAIEILQGKHRGSPLYQVSLFLAGNLLYLGEKAPSPEKGIELAESLLSLGRAKEKFKEMIKAQGGNPEVVEDTGLLPWASFTRDLNSPQEGYISAIDPVGVGMAALYLGAGRVKKDDLIDPAVGIILAKRKGDRVYKGELLAQIFANSDEKAKTTDERLLPAFSFSAEPPQGSKLIKDFIK